MLPLGNVCQRHSFFSTDVLSGVKRISHKMKTEYISDRQVNALLRRQ